MGRGKILQDPENDHLVLPVPVPKEDFIAFSWHLSYDSVTHLIYPSVSSNQDLIFRTIAKHSSTIMGPAIHSVWMDLGGFFPRLGRAVILQCLHSVLLCA